MKLNNMGAWESADDAQMAPSCQHCLKVQPLVMQGLPRSASWRRGSFCTVSAVFDPHQSAHSHLTVRDPGAGESDPVYAALLGPQYVPHGQ